MFKIPRKGTIIKVKEKIKVLTNGLVKENPSLRLVLGTCPTLAVTTLAVNGLGMGLAATFVLICSNIAISLLRKIIPDKVRLPAFITVIATFVTILQMLMTAYLPDLAQALGVFLPLIVVNCIILGRAEMYASKNGPVLSALDGLGMGLGFTLTLVVMGCIRELLGAGTLFGAQIFPETLDPIVMLITPPGGFLVFGILMALVVWVETKTNHRIPRNIGCEGCPMSGKCHADARGAAGCTVPQTAADKADVAEAAEKAKDDKPDAVEGGCEA